MSKSIYTQQYHYVYQITEKSTNKKYIGVRSSKLKPEDDLGIKYFSSSTNKDFIKRQKSNPADFIYEILSTYDDRSLAISEEVKLHEMYNVDVNGDFYNCAKQTSTKFESKGYVTAIDKNDKSIRIKIDDPRYISGELVGILKGKINVVDNDGNVIQTSIDDPRYISGELVGVNKGKVTVIDNEGNTFQTSIYDPRYISGELKTPSYGKFVAISKDGVIHHITSNDPRYVSGELKSIHADKVMVKDNDGNVIQISKDDPRYLSGEYVGITKGMFKMLDINTGKMVMAKYDDDRVKDKTLLSKYSYIINDIFYHNIYEVRIKFDFKANVIKSRCKSKKYENWIVIKNY